MKRRLAVQAFWSRLGDRRFGIIIISALFAVGALTGYLAGRYHPSSDTSFTFVLDTDTPYSFIRPLIGVVTSEEYGQSELTALHDHVAQVATNMPAGSLTRYAYYFRDLSDGRWTGINETDQYDPASMLKVVFAVAAYKQDEATPGFLDREFTYTQSMANVQSQFQFAPPVDLKVGETYSTPFLLKEMLSDSDNGAKDLLLSSIDQDIIGKMFTDLSITKPVNSNSPNFTISPQDYSRFLRILYYGTYDLSWKDSNTILELLGQATFTNGLVAGVPSAVPVAHKFGEHAITNHRQLEGVELSDCGIVYHPTHPYLICVMTEGKDPLALENFISKVSKATYDEVDADYKK